MGLAEAPSIHFTTIPSTLTVTLPVETRYAPDIFENYYFSPLDGSCNNTLCSSVEQMTNPSGPSLSILRRYPCSYPIIVSSERSEYSHCSLCYSHSLREIIVMGLLVVSNCEITKITVDADCGGTLYARSVPGGNEEQELADMLYRFETLEGASTK